MKINNRVAAYIFSVVFAIFGVVMFSFDVTSLKDRENTEINNLQLQREAYSNPTINSTLTNQEIELDDGSAIEIPAPNVNFELEDSTTYDVKDENPDKTYVVRGLNAAGKATNWTANNAYVSNGVFSPTKTGLFEIQYSVKLEAYNQKKFTFVESSVEWDEDGEPVYTLGGYYIFNGQPNSKMTLGQDGQFQIEIGGLKYLVEFEDEQVRYYKADNEFNKLIELEKEEISAFDGIDFELDIRSYVLYSDIYTIIVKDTKGPKLKAYDYSDQEFMPAQDFIANGIKIYGIEATDASGIDASKSEIRLSWKCANGTAAGETGSRTYKNADALSGDTYKSSATNLDGTYTITYEVYDNNGNKTTAIYTVNVGDNEKPKVVFPEGFVKTNYTLKDKLVIDLDPTKVIVTDNKPMPENSKLKIKLVNTSKNNEEVGFEIDQTKYIFNSFESYGEGTYKLTVEAVDAVGNVSLTDFEFEVLSTFNVEIQIDGQGKVELSPKYEGGYLRGTRVSLTLTAFEGWKLSKIQGVDLDEYNSFEINADIVIKVVFVAKEVSLANNEKGIHLETTADIVPEGSSLMVEMIVEGDQNYVQVKNLLSNPDYLIIYDISLFDKDNVQLEQLEGRVTMKIKLDGRFDAQKAKLFRIDVLTGLKQEYSFLYLDGYIVFETDHFSLYTLSQSDGFKPVSPSKDGTNKMSLTLLILGSIALVAVIAVAVAVVVNKKKR